MGDTAHGASQVKANEDMQEMSDSKLQKLGDLQNTPVSQLKFVTDAMRQIAECRRVLKWTYGYGFYNLESEEEAVKRRFFEFIQADAEMTLERLTETVETELAEYFHEEKSPEEFADFRGKLAGLTAVTGKYFDTLVRELEEGLPGVGTSDEDTASKEENGGMASAAGGWLSRSHRLGHQGERQRRWWWSTRDGTRGEN